MYGKYVAYVGSYTRGNAVGITIYDVDNENGYLKYRKEVEVSNPSYIKIDNLKRVLYTIDDAGVMAYKIENDGDLKFINALGINGMRGCFLELDSSGDFLYVAGYHDGKITMISLNSDGSLDSITDEIFFKGMGKPYEDSYRPHVSCCKLTPFEKFLCVADLSVSNYKVYEVDRVEKKLNFVSIIPCELNSSPREIIFSNTGRFAYTVCTRNKKIEGFKYHINENNKPVFTNIQKLTPLCDGMSEESAPYAISKNKDGTYIIVSIVEDNSVTFIKRDKETGLMEVQFNLPISGVFPKDIQFFPNEKFIASCNHESNEITVFEVKGEQSQIVMTQRPTKVYSPNCIRFCKINDEL